MIPTRCWACRKRRLGRRHPPRLSASSPRSCIPTSIPQQGRSRGALQEGLVGLRDPRRSREAQAVRPRRDRRQRRAAPRLPARTRAAEPGRWRARRRRASRRGLRLRRHLLRPLRRGARRGGATAQLRRHAATTCATRWRSISWRPPPGAKKRVTLPDGGVLDLNVPAGVADGQVLRLKGKGSPGAGGSEAGDALVEIRVRPHAQFKRDDDDIAAGAADHHRRGRARRQDRGADRLGPRAAHHPQGHQLGPRLPPEGQGRAQRRRPAAPAISWSPCASCCPRRSTTSSPTSSPSGASRTATTRASRKCGQISARTFRRAVPAPAAGTHGWQIARCGGARDALE